MKVQLLLNQEWGSRKRLINLKKEKIARKVSLLSYKKEVVARIKENSRREQKKLKPKTEKEIVDTLKSRLKRIKMTD